MTSRPGTAIYAALVTGVLILSGVLVLMPNATSYPEINYNSVVQSPPSDLLSQFLEQETMNTTGYPMASDDNAVYLRVGDTQLTRWTEATGFQTLHTFGGTVVRSIAIAGDNSILVACTNGSITRSADGGASWTVVLNMTSGGYAWRMAVLDNAVYAGEYGNPSGGNATLYKSSNNGVTWSSVAWTRNETSQEHIHVVAVDPVTDDVYFMFGDDEDGVKRSTDGNTFSLWGPAIQGTAMAFDANSIYFGDDPYGRIWVYNRTENKIAITAGLSTGPVYSMTVGVHGVIYASTVPEGIADRNTAIWASINGRDWARILYFGGEALAGTGISELIAHDSHIWILNQTGSLYRINDLTIEQAAILIYGQAPHSPASTYSHPSSQAAAWNNRTEYLSLGQDPLTNANITFIGMTVTNHVGNPGLESTENFNDITDWWKVAATGESANISATRSTYMATEGTYSLHLVGSGSAATHGSVMSHPWNDAGNPIVVGTKIWGSYDFFVNDSGDSSNPYNQYLDTEVWITYTDDTSYNPVVATTNVFYTLSSDIHKRTSPDWMHFYWTVTPTKAVKKVQLRYFVIGYLDAYVDAVQVQWNATSSDMTPFVNGTANTTNPSITIGSETFTYEGTLSSGQVGKVAIGHDLAGLYRTSFNISGSGACNWSIEGTRIADLSNGYLTYDDGLLRLNYSNTSVIEFWASGAIYPSDWGTGGSGGYWQFIPEAATRVNITPIAWAPSAMTGIVAEWNASFGANGSVTCSIAGLPSSYGYRIYQDGDLIATGTGPTLSFDANDNGTFEVEVWYPGVISTLIITTYNVLAIGIVAGVAGLAVSPLRNPKNRRPEKMTKILINAAIYLFIGLTMLGVIHEMFIG